MGLPPPEVPRHFDQAFRALTSFTPMAWQRRLFEDWFLQGRIPSACDIPTGLGKTSVMAIWYLALKAGARIPRRLVYVVDRRAVVDQATTEADKIRENASDSALRVSTLRGQYVDNREWLADPAAPAIVVGTVDMIGSRLLFSGYGVSSKMRPYHAGLLGVDTLVVLDEAHLVPPFEKLLQAYESGADTFGPRAEDDRKIVPPFKLLSLSATGGGRQSPEHTGQRNVFRLCDADLGDLIVKERLGASKHLTIDTCDDAKALAPTLAERAWFRGTEGDPARVLVYCNRRDDAVKVKEEIDKRLQKSGLEDASELFVGSRRVYERQNLHAWLVEKGFLAGAAERPRTSIFLVATSAGEVGVDLDADHIVCDLVEWERMVQRLGRVNRRGGSGRLAWVDVIATPKDKETTEDWNERLARLRAPLDQLPAGQDGRRDACPGALRELKLRAVSDKNLRAKIEAATTPEPLRPALTRPLVDAWSMTSLEKHTGRPEIDPWLRGWLDDEVQTSLVWRRHLPVRIAGASALKREIEDFFEAAPPHASEELETETYRVVDWLMGRAQATLRPARARVEQQVGSEAKEPGDQVSGQALEKASKILDKDDVVAFVLTPARELRESYRLGDLAEGEENKNLKDRLNRQLRGQTLVVDVRLAGLKDGLLKAGEDTVPPTADSGEWIEVEGCPAVRFRIRISRDATQSVGDGWRESFRFDIERSEDGLALRSLIVDGTNEERRSESLNPQQLDEHQSCTEAKARIIARGVDLSGSQADMLAVAARLHDEGKRANRWQRAFNAPHDGQCYAKTKGPVNLPLLGDYRHEFGSLPYAQKDAGFLALPPDMQDLVLHVIAAHHGRARPLIGTTGCEDAPPSALEGRACDVALRFARLQRRWGPWGLAWWEALLRAADQQASRENDQRGLGDGGS